MSDMDDAGDRLAERAIRYGGQTAAIGVRGLMETFDIDRSPLAKPWMTKILDGLVPLGSFPTPPNAAGAAAIKAPWWRRLLRRFGR